MGSRLRLLQARDDPSGARVWTEVRIAPSRRASTALAAVGALLLAGGLLAAGASRRGGTQVALVHVTVAPGDTLWGLAGRHCGPSEYLPKAVYNIRRANGLSTSRIVPGQHLVIPVHRKRQIDMPACMSIARAGTP